MLNEILECNQYKAKYSSINTTYCNKSGNKLGCSLCRETICPFRLSYAQIKQELSGIRRPLEIIARDALFKGKNTPNIKAAKTATTHWLKDSLTYQYLDEIYPHPLPDEEEKDPKELKTLKNQLFALRARYQKPIFTEGLFEENDINSCRVEKIIASAIEKGPLKRYILVAHKDPWGDNFKVRKNKGNTKKNTLTDGEKDYILKLTTAFLIDNTKKQQCIRITESDVLNWGINHTPPKNTTFYLETTGENIFKKEYVTQSTTPIKFRFIEKWISNFEIKDITATDCEQESLKYINDNKYYYYEDQGSGKKLKEHAPKKDDARVAKAACKKNG